MTLQLRTIYIYIYIYNYIHKLTRHPVSQWPSPPAVHHVMSSKLRWAQCLIWWAKKPIWMPWHGRAWDACGDGDSPWCPRFFWWKMQSSGFVFPKIQELFWDTNLHFRYWTPWPETQRPRQWFWSVAVHPWDDYGWLIFHRHINHCHIVDHVTLESSLVFQKRYCSILGVGCYIRDYVVFFPAYPRALYQVNNNGWSALIWCAINGCEEVATALLSASANYLTADNEGRSRVGCMPVTVCHGSHLKKTGGSEVGNS